MRKLERELIDIFESSIDTVLACVAAGTMTVDEATDIASLPQAVRGTKTSRSSEPASTAPSSPLHWTDRC